MVTTLPFSIPIKMSSQEASQLRAKVRKVTSGHRYDCKICGAPAIWFCALDFAVSGNDFFAGSRTFSDTGVEVSYFKCTRCGFLFSPSFWDFTTEDYRVLVYNDAYIYADPPFDEERPMRDAATIKKILGGSDPRLRMLDYGSGNGRFCSAMRDAGFANCIGFDPVYDDDSPPPAGQFDLVTCFEVIEHINDQHTFATTIRSLLAPSGFVILSTQLQPPSVNQDGGLWWYIEPRNGHVSIHTKESLDVLFENQGLAVLTVCQDLFAISFPHALPTLLRTQLSRCEVDNLCSDRNPLP